MVNGCDNQNQSQWHSIVEWDSFSCYSRVIGNLKKRSWSRAPLYMWATCHFTQPRSKSGSCSLVLVMWRGSSWVLIKRKERRVDSASWSILINVDYTFSHSFSDCLSDYSSDSHSDYPWLTLWDFLCLHWWFLQWLYQQLCWWLSSGLPWLSVVDVGVKCKIIPVPSPLLGLHTKL